MEQEKKKRVRKAPYRKWSEMEQQHLLKFLHENRPMEKPTSQLYYKRFLAEIGSEMHWSLVRCKVKNFRNNFLKAKSCHNVVTRICPFYDELELIFGNKELTANASVLDAADTNTLASAVDIPTTTENDVAKIFIAEEESSPLQETLLTASKAARIEGKHSRIPLAHILESHSNLVDVKKEKMKMDLAIREKELLLKEKHYQLQLEIFRFEKEKYKIELKIKEIEAKNQDRIKVMELEMKERIALKELEMKERIEMKKLTYQ